MALALKITTTVTLDGKPEVVWDVVPPGDEVVRFGPFEILAAGSRTFNLTEAGICLAAMRGLAIKSDQKLKLHLPDRDAANHLFEGLCFLMHRDADSYLANSSTLKLENSSASTATVTVLFWGT